MEGRQRDFKGKPLLHEHVGIRMKFRASGMAVQLTVSTSARLGPRSSEDSEMRTHAACLLLAARPSCFRKAD